ncbi:MAG: hypothetical protein HUJ96_07080 [Marinilabiliaceae bacterium]|nr:hypothetical protein [Marinilabiliaceae bacterium]
MFQGERKRNYTKNISKMDIKKLGLEELSAKDYKKYNGGFWLHLGLMLVGGLVCDIVFDPTGCAYEFNRGWSGN